MKLTKVKLGDLLQLETEKNTEEVYGLDSVKGISIKKTFIETKADMTGVSLKPYLLVKPDCFSFVTVTSRNGEKITLAHNITKQTFIVSSSYIVFRVKKLHLLNSDYLYMFFNRDEFDRYTRFNSWGSARETFSWETMCASEIALPPLTIQQKYVNIYKSLLANQQAYEKGLEDLKLVCDAYIEKQKKLSSSVSISQFLEQKNKRNTGNKNKNVMGLSTLKDFRIPQSRVNKEELSSYKIVKPNEFAFVPTTDTWKVFAFGLNNFGYEIVVSPIYEVFKIKNESILLPEYLSMWFKRKEFDRYVRFHSWGSARENFTWYDLQNVRIPIPPLSVQQSIVNIYKVLQTRRKINEQLKEQIKSICPILIKGSLEEAERR